MTEAISWIPLGLLTETSTDFSIYSKDIGVYRAILNDEIVYIGKATELENGGFRKRLRDYTRSSASARKYPAGELMYSNRNNVYIEITLFERAIESIRKI
jgi:excinuclease UvrABC nuclease subunit